MLFEKEYFSAEVISEIGAGNYVNIYFLKEINMDIKIIPQIAGKSKYSLT